MGKTQDEDIVHAYNLIHSVISDIAIFRENIEKDFHDWFMDASRIGSELGIVLTVPRLSGRQQHRANAGPENPDPEVYYRINVAIPFMDHMEQVLNNRFHPLYKKLDIRFGIFLRIRQNIRLSTIFEL